MSTKLGRVKDSDRQLGSLFKIRGVAIAYVSFLNTCHNSQRKQLRTLYCLPIYSSLQTSSSTYNWILGDGKQWSKQLSAIGNIWFCPLIYLGKVNNSL